MTAVPASYRCIKPLKLTVPGALLPEFPYRSINVTAPILLNRGMP
ncbi:hypothetical protein X742_18825 [Mesorhizobium sp. LNHC232B00]|nr:hypothetical protein X742_18825 [Mesorhizobium sp. LNHC232B00]ESZ23669.1 hypothetical protein X734_25300 [Mesorhizobium sp. L2C084A000]